MPKRRLLWRLYFSYLAVTVAALVGVGWFAVHSSEQLYLDRVRDDLQTRARAVADRIGPDWRPSAEDSALAEPVASASYIHDLDAASELCRSLGQATGTRLVLLSPSGEVVCDSQGKPAELKSLGGRKEVEQALAGQSGGDTRYDTAAEKRLASLALPVVRGGKVVGVVYAAMPIDAVDRALAAIQVRIVLAGLFILALAAVLGWLVSRHLSRAVAEMRQGAARFARGELGYHLAVPESEEFGGLAEALNQMAEQLQERIRTTVRQSNEQQAVLSSLVEGVLAVDTRERIISLNRAVGQLLSIDPAQAASRSLKEVVRNADLQRFVSRALAEGRPLDDDVVMRGGPERVLQARSAALHDSQGRVIGAVIVLNDITEFRALELMRREFVANVSHELKTPITSIKGFVETLLDGAMREPAEAERFLRIVARQSDRMNAIIEDLLSLSKIEQDKESGEIALEREELIEVLEAAVHSCQSQAAERAIEVQLTCEPGIFARINAPLLEQAVINLLDNAIKYSEPHSAVRVEGAQKNGEVTISVIDRGCGIDSEHLPRVFERFYRVDKARSRKLGGTGLGLAIVKHIVQAHQGRVAATSFPGAGSTFTIELPRPKP